MVFSVFVLEELEPLGRHLHQIRQIAIYFFNLSFDAGHQLVGFVLVELQDALHLDFQQAQDVILGHLAYHLRIVGGQSLVNVFADAVDVGSLLKLLVLVDAFLDEYLLQ